MSERLTDEEFETLLVSGALDTEGAGREGIDRLVAEARRARESEAAALIALDKLADWSLKMCRVPRPDGPVKAAIDFLKKAGRR